MYDLLLRHPFMSAEGLKCVQAKHLVDAMRTVEFAAAAEQEELGLIPKGSANAIEVYLGEHVFDLEGLAQGAVQGGNAAIPFVKQAKAVLPDELRRHFHKGLTSQDILDSALMVVLKPRLERCLYLLRECEQAGRNLMISHRDTPMMGRTLMQQALPITFGAKVANWLWGLHQAKARLADVVRGGLYLQLGGAVGVHSGLDGDGLRLMDGVARRLGLRVPLLPWHTDRQPVLALGSALDALAVATEKIALDVGLMSQTEVDEVREPAEEGVGQSSSMPHKRNPVGCVRIRAAARQICGLTGILNSAAAQPLERGLGEWQAEWAPMMDAVLLLEGSLETLADMLSGLEVRSERMRQNLALTCGAIMAGPAADVLSEALGSDRACQLAGEAAEKARSQGRAYADVLLDEPGVRDRIDAESLRRAVDPALYIGSSKAQVQRVVNLLDSE